MMRPFSRGMSVPPLGRASLASGADVGSGNSRRLHQQQKPPSTRRSTPVSINASLLGGSQVVGRVHHGAVDPQHEVQVAAGAVARGTDVSDDLSLIHI